MDDETPFDIWKTLYYSGKSHRKKSVFTMKEDNQKYLWM